MQTGLLCLFLVLFLSACTSNPVVRTEVVVPPKTFMAETPKPTFSGTATGELVPFIRELNNALDSCNDDKQALRDWSSTWQ